MFSPVEAPVLATTMSWGFRRYLSCSDWVTFFPEEWDGRLFVRVVGVEQVKEWRKTLCARDQDMLLGVNYLKNWLDSGGRDEYALDRAYFRLRPHIPDLEPPPERIIRTKNATFIFPEQKGLAAVHNYSRILTELVKLSRVVMWYSRELYRRALPALYCPDKRTAVFASRLIGPVRICAYEGCGAVFIPDAKNKTCCNPAHAANYRQAKCRAK